MNSQVIEETPPIKKPLKRVFTRDVSLGVSRRPGGKSPLSSQIFELLILSGLIDLAKKTPGKSLCISYWFVTLDAKVHE